LQEIIMNSDHRLGTLAVLFFAAAVSSAARAEAPAALAGFAEADITPPLGIDLGGRGCRDSSADEVLDPLQAAATILKDSRGSTLVIVSLDLVGLPRALSEQIRGQVAGKLGIPVENVLLNCSHTHSGPMMYRETMAGCGGPTELEQKYRDELAAKVYAMVTAAAGRLSPATVQVHQGKCDVGINRRGKSPSGQTLMKPNPDAPYDPTVWILRVTSPEGKTRAVLFSYACHPVIVYTYAWSKISAEYPGVARQEIRAGLGKDVHVQFIQGPAGNVRPRCLADLEKREFRKGKPEDKEQAGKDLASAVLTALKADGKTIHLRLAASMERVFLKRGTPPDKSFYEEIAKSPKDYRASGAQYWLEQYEKGGPVSKGDEAPVGVVRLADDQWVFYLSGEPVVEWARHARLWFGDKPLVVWGYMQQAFSYVPVDEILKEGGYEVDSSNQMRLTNPAPFAEGLNEAVRASVLHQIAAIEGQSK
jgi:neutral ceramidase